MLFSPSPRRRRLQLRISERRLLLMFGDALAVIASVLISLRIWAFVADEAFTLAFVLPQSYWFFVLAVLWLLLASANDFYELPVAADRWRSMQHLVAITLQMLVVYFIVFFFSPRTALPRLFIFYYGISSFILIVLWRMLNPALVGWAASARRILIIGANDSAAKMIEAIHEYGQGTYEIRGIISNADDIGTVVAGVPVVGSGRDLLNYIWRDRISELVITSIPDMDGDVFRGVMDAYEQGVVLVPMPLLYERITGRVPVLYVRNNWAMVLPITGQSIFNPYPMLQRIVDVVFAVVGLAFLLLALPFLALLIRLDSPGSIFYMQSRTGRNGRIFRMIKFRTMVKDAERQTGAVFSEAGDPRVTRVGRFFRKTRIDELPQLFNVLYGQMSIVGPRPERPEHIERLTAKIPFYRTRLVVRPGLTGWAQVQYHYGSNDEDAEMKLEYDLYYIRHQSLALDFNIMIRTIGRVIRMAGV